MRRFVPLAAVAALALGGCGVLADAPVRCAFTAEVGAPFDSTYAGTGAGIRGIGRFDADGTTVPMFEVYLGDRRAGDWHTFVLVIPTTEAGDDVRGVPPGPARTRSAPSSSAPSAGRPSPASRGGS